MDILFFAFILAWSYNGDQFYGYGSTNPNLKGLETRYEIALGPQGPTKEECESNADRYRKWLAAEGKIKSYMQVKIQCLPMELATK